MSVFVCLFCRKRFGIHICRKANRYRQFGKVGRGGACIGIGWAAALLHSTAVFPCGGVPYREKPENGGIKGTFKDAYGVF